MGIANKPITRVRYNCFGTIQFRSRMVSEGMEAITPGKEVIDLPRNTR